MHKAGFIFEEQTRVENYAITFFETNYNVKNMNIKCHISKKYTQISNSDEFIALVSHNKICIFLEKNKIFSTKSSTHNRDIILSGIKTIKYNLLTE